MKGFDWPVVGHENIVNFLQKSIVNDKLSHAYLFYGPEKVGKSSLAENFRASLICKGREAKPCRKCSACIQFFRGIYPDIYEINKEKNRKNIRIEQIRELKDKLNLGSFLNSYKIAVIQGAEYLNSESTNALLKTLEEPLGKTIIILIASDISFLPETVISRCQTLKFLTVSRNKIYDLLISKGADRNTAKNLAHLSAGRPGLAIDFLENEELYNYHREKVIQLIDIIKKGGIGDKFSLLESLSPNRMPLLESVAFLNNILDIWSSVFRDLFLIKFSSSNLMANLFAQKDLVELSKNYDSQRIIDLLEQTKKTKRYLYQNINPHLALENLILYF